MKPRAYNLQVWCTAGCVNTIKDMILEMRRAIHDDITNSEEIMGVQILRELTDVENAQFNNKENAK